jgi:hypothetical protein
LPGSPNDPNGRRDNQNSHHNPNQHGALTKIDLRVLILHNGGGGLSRHVNTQEQLDAVVNRILTLRKAAGHSFSDQGTLNEVCAGEVGRQAVR